MAQPRYNAALQEFMRQWHPNDPELNQRFIADIKALLAAVLAPPQAQFEVTTILTQDGGKVVARLGEYEAQMDPLDSQHLGLSLIEAATAARTESFLQRFLHENIGLDDAPAAVAGMIGAFRNYRIEEMERELTGDLEKRSRPVGKD